MRQIKFRGRRSDNKEWVYGYYVVTPTKDHRIYWQPFDEATSNTYHRVIPETVGEFTGFILDEGLTPVFEGDVLQLRNRRGLKMPDSYEVIYQAPNFKIRSIRPDGKETLTLPLEARPALYGSFEIIGTIHD
jgi:hypothetical protein